MALSNWQKAQELKLFNLNECGQIIMRHWPLPRVVLARAYLDKHIVPCAELRKGISLCVRDRSTKVWAKHAYHSQLCFNTFVSRQAILVSVAFSHIEVDLGNKEIGKVKLKPWWLANSTKVMHFCKALQFILTELLTKYT